MLKGKRALWSAGIVLLTLAMLFGCARVFWDDSQQSGWYIQLNVGDPGAKGVGVDYHDVTGLEIAVYGPDQQLLDELEWDAVEGPQSYVVQVNQEGTHRIEVTHISDGDGETVEVSETAEFEVEPMVITVIDIIPGAIGCIEVEGGQPPEPIDLSGYWDFSFTIGEGTEEEQDIGPIVMYVYQSEDSNLYCDNDFYGNIDGYDVEFFQDEYMLHMVGTVDGDQIAGDVTSALGDGTFLMEYPSSAPFGHLFLQGSVGGTDIELDTQYCLGSGPSVEGDEFPTTHFEANYFNHESTVWVWMSVSGVVPEIGEADPPMIYYVPDTWIDVEWRVAGEEPPDDYVVDVEMGSLTLTRFDETGLAGTIDFGDSLGEGDWLQGNFDLSWWNEWSPDDE